MPCHRPPPNRHTPAHLPACRWYPLQVSPPVLGKLVQQARWGPQTAPLLSHACPPGPTSPLCLPACLPAPPPQPQNLEGVPHANADFTYVDGDGTVPAESSAAHGLGAAGSAAVGASHRGLVADKASPGGWRSLQALPSLLDAQSLRSDCKPTCPCLPPCPCPAGRLCAAAAVAAGAADRARPTRGAGDAQRSGACRRRPARAAAGGRAGGGGSSAWGGPQQPAGLVGADGVIVPAFGSFAWGCEGAAQVGRGGSRLVQSACRAQCVTRKGKAGLGLKFRQRDIEARAPSRPVSVPPPTPLGSTPRLLRKPS